MSEDELIAEARRRDQQRATNLGDYTPVEQVLTLAAEVEHLRKQVALFRPIVEVVAKAGQPFDAQPGSGVEILYARTGTQEQARAALAEADEDR